MYRATHHQQPQPSCYLSPAPAQPNHRSYAYRAAGSTCTTFFSAHAVGPEYGFQGPHGNLEIQYSELKETWGYAKAELVREEAGEQYEVLLDGGGREDVVPRLLERSVMIWRNAQATPQEKM